MAPPGPIPNPEVKHQHVDGSRTTGPARVDSCQGKRSPETEKVSGLSISHAPRRRSVFTFHRTRGVRFFTQAQPVFTLSRGVSFLFSPVNAGYLSCAPKGTKSGRRAAVRYPRQRCGRYLHLTAQTISCRWQDVGDLGFKLSCADADNGEGKFHVTEPVEGGGGDEYLGFTG